MDVAAWVRTRIEALESIAQRALSLVLTTTAVAAATAAKILSITRIQAGTAQMTNGVTAAIPVTSLDANTTIVVSYHTLNGNANTVMLTATNRTNGTPGSFQIEALGAGGAGNAADQSSVDWHLIQP